MTTDLSSKSIKELFSWCSDHVEHIPSLGDTVRLNDEKFAKVTEVVWCMDEKSTEGQRVNLGLETDEDGRKE